MEKSLSILAPATRDKQNTKKKTKEAVTMTKVKNLYYQAAMLFSTLLSAVLFICANSNSCFMIHQPKAPKALSRYSRFE